MNYSMCFQYFILFFSFLMRENITCFLYLTLQLVFLRVIYSSLSISLYLLPPSPEHPLVILAHRASILPPGSGVVWHDAGVPLESHHPDRERWPRGPRSAEEAGDTPGGERDEGERPSASRGRFLQRVHILFCVCVCSCNTSTSEVLSMYVNCFLFLFV